MSGAVDDGNLCVFNGIDGSTGRYLTPPMGPRQLLEAAIGAVIDKNRPEAETIAKAITGDAAPKLLSQLECGMNPPSPTSARPGVDTGRLEEPAGASSLPTTPPRRSRTHSRNCWSY